MTKNLEKVCYNQEKHLRGNTYIEFAELRCAVTAYRALHTRWYGGRQLSLEFCRLMSWKHAVCGSFLRNRCPKGRGCNFLHVFKNPRNLFDGCFDEDLEDGFNERTPRSARSWRWSESPERDVDKRSRRSEDRDRRRSSRHDEDRSRHHRRSSPRRSRRR
ncbi:unnamed protein product [Chrysodeixis includens]|uniref:C3H1-type domain-containing protein n=1 Tax=Chrysodeixis includens TaxID=689277 RepID=A0A9N8PXH6_CHRIL|nr:unnamed protein product [Chrysodeixis includens]